MPEGGRNALRQRPAPMKAACTGITLPVLARRGENCTSNAEWTCDLAAYTASALPLT